MQSVPVVLPDGRQVEAVTAANDRTASSYVGDVPVAERQRMVKVARGRSGTCEHYAWAVRGLLKKVKVRDPRRWRSLSPGWSDLGQSGKTIDSSPAFMDSRFND